MKRFVSIGLTVLFVFLQIFVSAQAADHWPLNAKLKYFYNSAGEPTGAASAFGSAVASWNTSISCFSFETGTMGAINWITDKSTWDAIPNSTKKAGGITGTDYSTSFLFISIQHILRQLTGLRLLLAR
jgi:hypothetical protein